MAESKYFQLFRVRKYVLFLGGIFQCDKRIHLDRSCMFQITAVWKFAGADNPWAQILLGIQTDRQALVSTKELQHQ